MSHHHKSSQEERGPHEATLPATRPPATTNFFENTTGRKLFSHDSLMAHLGLVRADLKVDYPTLLDLMCERISQCIQQIQTNPEDKRTIYQNLDQLGDYLDEAVDYHRYLRDRIRDLKNQFLTATKLDGESVRDILS